MLEVMPEVLFEKVKVYIQPNRSGSLHHSDKGSEKLLFFYPVASPDSCPMALFRVSCSGGGECIESSAKPR